MITPSLYCMKKIDDMALIKNYKMLGCAVIQEAIVDYADGRMSYASLSNFLKGALWVQCLDLDIDNLLEKARTLRERKEEVKKSKRQLDS